MANTKISQMPNLANPTGDTIAPVVKSGVNYSATMANIATYVNTNATTISASGNITGAYIAGDGSTLSNLPAANISGTVANAAYATNAGLASSATSVAAANIVGTVATSNLASFVTSNAQGNITSVGTLTSLTVSGNITGSYFLGNGSQLTGLPATYSNANVITLLSSFGSNTISTTGNITGGYILGNGSQLTGLPVAYSNANVVSLLAAFGSNTISTTGNVATGNLSITGEINATGNINGNFFNGNGSALTGVVDIGSSQTVTGSKTFTGTTTLYPYVEYTNTSGLTTSTSFTPTMSNGPVQRVTANNSFALNAPSGMTTGQSITLIIRQDATGSRIMTSNAAYKYAGNIRALSTAANSIDVLMIFYDGTNYLATLNKGYV